MPSVLNSSKTIYLASLGGTIDRLTSQRSKRIDFYYDHIEADTKMFVFSRFLCDNIRLNRVIIVLPDTDVAVISLYQNVTNLTFLDAVWFKTGTGDNQRYTLTHLLASELGLQIWCLLPAMPAVSGCDSACSFSHTGKITAFQTLKNKINELTELIDFSEFPTLYLESPSVVTLIQYVYYFYKENKSVSNVNKLRHRMFIRKNVSGDPLAPTLDALVLHLRRVNYQTFIWKSACVQVLN